MKDLVLGIGNRYRGDDAIGLLLAEALRDKMEFDCDFAISRGEGLELMETWKGRSRVILLDAVVGRGTTPGRVLSFDLKSTPLSPHFATGSSHGMGIAESVELARTLGYLPDKLNLVGVTCSDFEFREGLSADLKSKFDDIFIQVKKILEALCTKPI